MSLPRYISARDITNALNEGLAEPVWRTQRVSRILTNMGIAKKIGSARGVWVTPADLAGAWPDMFEGVLSRLELIKVTKEKGRRTKTIGNGANQQVSVSNGTHACQNGHNQCEYELGGIWSCAPECSNPDHMPRHCIP